MRKLFLLAALCATTFVNAQTTAACNVSVTLADIMSIEIAPGQGNVVVPITTQEQLVNGNDTDALGQLKISSSGAYQVTLQAASDFSNGTESIPVSTMKVSLSTSSGGNAGDITYATALGVSNTTAQQVILTDGGDVERYVSVNYAESGGDHFLNLPAGTYITTFTYTIMAP